MLWLYLKHEDVRLNACCCCIVSAMALKLPSMVLTSSFCKAPSLLFCFEWSQIAMSKLLPASWSLSSADMTVKRLSGGEDRQGCQLQWRKDCNTGLGALKEGPITPDLISSLIGVCGLFQGRRAVEVSGCLKPSVTAWLAFARTIGYRRIPPREAQ